MCHCWSRPLVLDDASEHRGASFFPKEGWTRWGLSALISSLRGCRVASQSPGKTGPTYLQAHLGWGDPQGLGSQSPPFLPSILLVPGLGWGLLGDPGATPDVALKLPETQVPRLGHVQGGDASLPMWPEDACTGTRHTAGACLIPLSKGHLLTFES